MSTTTDSELRVGVLHDLDGLSDLVGAARTEDTFRVHDLVVGPEASVLVLVDIIPTEEDGVRDVLAEGVAAIGFTPPGRGRRSGGE
jgi:hypothetical protein